MDKWFADDQVYDGWCEADLEERSLIGFLHPGATLLSFSTANVVTNILKDSTSTHVVLQMKAV